MRALIAAVLWLWAAPVSAQERLFALSEAVAVTAHASDLAATQRCLGAGRCRELNPWLARFDDPIAFSVAKFGVASVGLYAARKVPNRWLGAAINFGVASAFFTLAAHNVRVSK